MTGRIAIYNARILDPASGRDEKGGALIENGIIADVGASIIKTTVADVKIDAKAKALAPGRIDLRVKTGEPGAENKETLETAGEAAAAGGVTSMIVMPDTDPVIDTVALVDFIQRRSEGVAKVKVYPTGGLTLYLDGQ
jgi:dihydroorotase